MTNTIKLRTGAIIIQEGCILLVPHRNKKDDTIKWYLPGGKVEFGETFETAAVREVREETGFEVELQGLFDVAESIIPAEPWHSVAVCYRARITGGTLRAEEHPVFGKLTPEWFPLAALPHIVDYLQPVIDRLT